MPKFPKTFGRRKSTPNPFEDLDTTPAAGSSFRVFERPIDADKSFDGGVKITRLKERVSSSPISKDENIFEDLKGSRGSGVSNTNTVSTTDNSSRFSAASTTPSSMDIQNQEEWRSPHDKPIKDLPPLPRASTVFSLKAAAHTFSFSRGKASTPSPTRTQEEFPSSPQGRSSNGDSQRQRNFTATSYASTATPPRLDERDLGLSLGGDFADMFAGFGQRSSPILQAQNDRARSPTPDSYSPSGTSRPLIVNRSSQPSPLNIDRSRDVEPGPYSWTSHNSDDRLISNSSPKYPSTENRKENFPPSGPQRPAAVADSGVKRSSAFAVRRQSTLEMGDLVDEDARLLKESVTASRFLNSDSPLPSRPRDSWLLNPDSPQPSRPRDSLTQPLLKDSHNAQRVTYSDRQVNSPATNPSDSPLPSRPRDSWIQPLMKDSPNTQRATYSDRPVNSSGTNPRGNIAKAPVDEDNLFDYQVRITAPITNRYSLTPRSPSTNKVMTPAQFEKYKQELDGSTTVGGRSHTDDDNEEDTYDDEEDEAEKQKQLAKLRRKQEAHMSVYRQQMMKVTGEPVMSRPILGLSHSAPNLLNDHSGGAEGGEDEDEEVPLAILAAHGFPNKNKPPTQLSTMNSNPNLLAATQMGAYPPPPQSVAGESHGGVGGRLPVFARNLPQDPYIGAGLVRPSNRESLAFGGGAGPPPPGGLVNVIVREEMSRAMRRGSPNAAGEYVPPPANGFSGLGMPPNSQMPHGMNGMGQMAPGDQSQFDMAQQMQQFMQVQMQFMQMQMMTQGSQHQNGPPPLPRASTMMNMNSPPRPGHQHKRAMSSLDLNSAPWMQQQQQQRYSMLLPPPQGAGYTPSIAPSERSNVGMPGRYRPVSHYQGDNSRGNAMSGGLQNWSENKTDSQTIRAIKKSGTASDEDDEVGWQAMKQKREKKKSVWKSKRDTKDMEGLPNWN